MLEFHKQKAKNPAKTDPESRIKDFQEIYSQFDNKTSVEQSSRCSQCGVPYCQIHCPLNNNIPDWLRYIAEDRLEEAYQISSSTNVFLKSVVGFALKIDFAKVTVLLSKLDLEQLQLEI